MVVVMKLTARPEEIAAVQQRLEQAGFQAHFIHGVKRLVIGAVGDRAAINSLGLEALAGVERVVPIMKPYKLVSREVKGENSLIKVKDAVFGGGKLVVIAGPCAVESREQLLTAARRVRQAGAMVLRGGAFKPRTSPYSFRGWAKKGCSCWRKLPERPVWPLSLRCWMRRAWRWLWNMWIWCRWEPETCRTSGFCRP